MAIELNTRTKILAGVVVLAAAGAATWYFYGDEFFKEPPPAAKVAAKAPAKPAADAAKPTAEAPKPAAAKPVAAKPIPTNPDKLVAEIIEISGVKAQIQIFGREVGRNASEASQSGRQKMSDADVKAIYEISGRIFEPEKITAEVAAALKAAYDASRMTRFL